MAVEVGGEGGAGGRRPPEAGTPLGVERSAGAQSRDREEAAIEPHSHSKSAHLRSCTGRGDALFGCQQGPWRPGEGVGGRTECACVDCSRLWGSGAGRQSTPGHGKLVFKQTYQLPVRSWQISTARVMATQAVCPHPCLKAPLRSSPETTSCPGREGQSPPQRQSTEGSTLKVPFCREAFVQLRLSHDGNAGDVLPLPRCSIPGTEKWVAWRLRQWASNHGAREARAAPPHGLGEPDVPHLHQPRSTAGPRLSSTVTLGRACQQRDEGSGQAGAFPSLSP